MLDIYVVSSFLKRCQIWWIYPENTRKYLSGTLDMGRPGVPGRIAQVNKWRLVWTLGRLLAVLEDLRSKSRLAPCRMVSMRPALVMV